MMPVVSFVIYLVRSKRHITNHTVKETILKLCCFKSLYGNLVFLI